MMARRSRSNSRDSRTDPIHRIPRQIVDRRWLVFEPPIERQHGDAMDVGPDEERHLVWIVRPYEARPLLRRDGVHEHLNGPGSFLRQLGVAGIGDVRAEHHAVMRRMLDSEPHVGDTHRLESLTSLTVLVPGAFEL